MKSMVRSSLVVLTLALGGTACTGAEATDEAHDAAEVGQLMFALEARGPDGANYALPIGLRINIVRASDGAPMTTVSLDDPGSTLRFPIEAGAYVGELVNLTTDDGDTFLYRELENGWDPVSAEFLSDNPISFEVRPGETTSLALRFRLATLGDVVFDVGTVDVQVGIENSATPGQARGFYSQGDLEVGLSEAPHVSTHPILSGLRNLPAGTAVDTFVEVERTGEWDLEPQEICAPVRVTSATATDPFAMNVLFGEARGATGRACFRTAEGSGNVSLWLERVGAPNHSELAGEVPDTVRVQLSMSGDPDHVLVENGRLRLSELREPITLTNGYLGMNLSDGSLPSGSGTTVLLTLGGTFSFVARL